MRSLLADVHASRDAGAIRRVHRQSRVVEPDSLFIESGHVKLGVLNEAREVVLLPVVSCLSLEPRQLVLLLQHLKGCDVDFGCRIDFTLRLLLLRSSSLRVILGLLLLGRLRILRLPLRHFDVLVLVA